MATWVRASTSQLQSVDVSLESTGVALDNGTAPADFDPANVTAVSISVQVTGTVFNGDDSWNMEQAADGGVLINGATSLTADMLYSTGGGTGFKNETQSASGSDSSPNTGATTGDWEAAVLADVSGGAFATYVKIKGPDGGTLTAAAGDIVVTITYTPTSTTVTPAVVPLVEANPTPTITVAPTVLPTADAFVFDAPTPTAGVLGTTVTPATVGLGFAAPTPTVLAAATVTPAALGLIAAVPTPTVVVTTGNAQQGFRIRSGDTVGLNVDSGWEAALNTSAAMAILDLPFRIRFLVKNDSGSTVTDGYQLRVSIDGGAYTLIQNNNDPWDLAAGGNKYQVEAIPSDQYADLDATTQLIGSGTFVAGDGNEDNTQASLSLADGEETELEWCINLRKLATNLAGTDHAHTPAGTTFDFRVYYDDGTPLDAYAQTPRVTINNTVGHIGGTEVETPNRIFVKDKSGNLYYLTEYADLPNTVVNVPVMMKSTDGGASWNPVDEAGAPTLADLEAADLDYVASEDTIHIAIQGPSSNTAYYWTFRTADHATNPDTWNLNETVDSAATPGDQQAALHKRSDGTVVLFYGDNDGNERVRYRIRSSGGTWGGENDLDGEASTNVAGVKTVMDPADDTIHIFYHTWNGTVGEIWHKTLNSSDTLSGRSQVDQTAAINVDGGTRVGNITTPVIWTDGATKKVGVAYHEDGGTDDLYWNESAVSSISFTNEATALTNVDTNLLGGSSVEADSAVDDVSDDVWVMGIDGTNQELKYDQRIGGTWQGDTSWDTDTEHRVRALVFTHSAGNGGNRVLGFIHHDKHQLSFVFGAANGFARYDEIVLATVATPAAIALGFAAPTPTAGVLDVTVTPATAALVNDEPLPTITVAPTVTPAVVPLVEANPTPTIAVAPTVTPAVVALLGDEPQPSLSIAPTVLPATVALLGDEPTPTILAAAVVTPAAVVLIGDEPNPSIVIGKTVTPTTVALITAAPTPTIQAAATVTPAVAPLVEANPTPTTVAGTQVNPTTVALVADVIQPTVQAASLVTPAVAALVAALPTPTVAAAVTVTPTTAALIGDVPLPTVTVAPTVLPAVAALVAALPTPTAGVNETTVTPAVVPIVAALPTPTPTIPATVTPAADGFVLGVPNPAALGQGTVTPAAVSLITAVPIPAIAAAASISPNLVPLVTGIPTPGVVGQANVFPGVASILLDVPDPVASAGSVRSPSTVALFTTVPPTAATVAPTVLPATVTVVVSVLAVTTDLTLLVVRYAGGKMGSANRIDAATSAATRLDGGRLGQSGRVG